MILIHSSDTWDHTITMMLERMRWDLEISIMEEVTPEMRVSYRSSIYFSREKDHRSDFFYSQSGCKQAKSRQ